MISVSGISVSFSISYRVISIRDTEGVRVHIPVRGVRPGFWDVRPGKRDALAIFQRMGGIGSS